MEYVDGLPLLSHMRAVGSIPPPRGLRFFKQICRALALVHGQGASTATSSRTTSSSTAAASSSVVDFGLAAFADAPLRPRRRGARSPTWPRRRSGPFDAGLGRLQHRAADVRAVHRRRPHLTAPWAPTTNATRSRENHRSEDAPAFAAAVGGTERVRNEYRWLDAVILAAWRPSRSGASRTPPTLLAAIEACDGEAAAPPANSGTPRKIVPRGDEHDTRRLFREVRRLLAGKAYEQVIDRLDVHRPAEWAVLDATGRGRCGLGQAYLGRGELVAARECLEQLRAGQRERAVLPKPDYAAALSDLCKCYRGLGLGGTGQGVSGGGPRAGLSTMYDSTAASARRAGRDLCVPGAGDTDERALMAAPGRARKLLAAFTPGVDPTAPGCWKHSAPREADERDSPSYEAGCCGSLGRYGEAAAALEEARPGRNRPTRTPSPSPPTGLARGKTELPPRGIGPVRGC